MTCADCTKQLALLVSGDLSPVSRAAIDQHLSHCPDCRRHLDQLEKTVLLLKKAGQDMTVPSDFSTRLHARLLQEPAPRIPLSTRLWWKLESLGLDSGPRLGACAMAFAVLVLLFIGTLRGGGPGRATVFVPEETVAASFRIPSHRVAVVQLDFVADASVDDVEFEITLPGELEFIDGGQAISERHLDRCSRRLSCCLMGSRASRGSLSLRFSASPFSGASASGEAPFAGVRKLAPKLPQCPFRAIAPYSRLRHWPCLSSRNISTWRA